MDKFGAINIIKIIMILRLNSDQNYALMQLINCYYVLLINLFEYKIGIII